MRLETHPFDDEHVDAAARLLSQRHGRHRRAEPLLSARHEDPDVARAAVAEAWALPDASGTVATRGGEVVGYLLGAPKPPDLWGENVWVESAGHAADSGETARELYAAASGPWVETGRLAHYVLLPAFDDELVRAWFRLGFGHQHTHAIRELPTGRPSVPEHLRVRQAVREDIPALARLEQVLPAQHAAPPTFSSGRTGSYEESLAEWEADFEDPRFHNVVVEHEGRVVGSACGCRREVSSMHRGPALVDGAWFLGFAAVLPEARGLGAGRALGEAVAWAGREGGHVSLVTDWRETNLTSTRAWRALGYRDTFTRVHRLVGH